MKRILPHLCAVMAVSLIFITYLDDRNPMMGFLRSQTSRIYIILFCLVVLITAVLSIADRRRKDSILYKEQQKIEASRDKMKETESK